jgi:5-methylcytosine-specific restriction endonuclease McrA
MECARRRAKANPEKNRARCAAYRARNPEKRRAYALANAEKIAEQGRELRARKSEHERARHRAYYAKHLEKVRETHAAYRAATTEKKAAHCRNRRARIRMAEGFHTAEDIQRICTVQNGKCAICKEKVGKKFHVDHVQPLTKGGSNWPANLQILCGSCNRRKHNRDPIDHMQSLGFLL